MGALSSQWRRDCKKCGRIQVRNKPPVSTSPSKAKRSGRQAVARTKGDLVIRRVEGTEERVPGAAATRAARAAIPKVRKR